MIKTKIEWCDSSWNPVVGCFHSCQYCYARGIANRYKGCLAAPSGDTTEKLVVLDEKLQAKTNDGKIRNAAYPYGFTPTFHRYRLDDPLKKGFGKTIFVCSMADLFGDWVPEEWILEVFEACKAADNHRYLFLTKNPERYVELAKKGKLPEGDNFWYGTTITSPNCKMFYGAGYNNFASIEPILAPFEDVEGCKDFVNLVDWVILGAETGNRKDKVVPERWWMEPIVEKFHAAGKPVFMKDSLIPIWGDNLITQFPW